jgi:hypothetical protein
MVHSGAPAEDSIVMCLEADTRVCMLDRAGNSNELFRFSTTMMQWEQLDAPQVSGSRPSARFGHGMVAVGSDLYVFGGDIADGDTRRLRCWQSSCCMPDRAQALLCAVLRCLLAHAVLERDVMPQCRTKVW